jgi:hypothetical protein
MTAPKSLLALAAPRVLKGNCSSNLASADNSHPQYNPHGRDEAGLLSPIVVFRERAEARAMLCSNGLLDLQTAVDGMQESAAAHGLITEHGQDMIQRILSEIFARWR